MSKAFFCATPDFEASRVVLVGIPFDATSSFRPGSRFAPDHIRLYSDGIESYSPYQQADLEDLAFYDAGNIEVTISNFSILRNTVRSRTEEYLRQQKKIIALGGEHLVTLPIIEAYANAYPNLHVIHFDAHADLRDEYLGERYSHATVMRRVCDLIGGQRLYQFGIRSGAKTEFAFGQANTHFYPFLPEFSQFEEAIEQLRDVPVYLSLDLDVLDPACFPGTGTPEAGGVSFEQLLRLLLALKRVRIVGGDLVELCPHHDQSDISTLCAIKLLREILLLTGASPLI